MRILLIGIGGVYNYGCEAIIRGTERILRQALPDVELVYHATRPAEDALRLAGCRVAVRPRHRCGMDRLVRRLLNKPFRLLGRMPPLDLERAVAGFDLVLSVGGDLYTEYGGQMPWATMELGEKIMRKGIPYAVWGASIGPFRGKPNEIERLMAHFRRCRFIAVRENRTHEYLAKQGVDQNLFSMLDPAFALGSGASPESRPAGYAPGGRIGVNLSPLSVRETGADRRQMVAKQGAMIGRLVAAAEADVLLLPHVVSTAEPEDDDLSYLRQVRAAVPAALHGRVQLVDNDPGFLGIKPALRTCDVVLAARMHCGINALSEGVPVLFLAYSEKAWGMAERMYGHKRYVLDVRDSGSADFIRNLLDALSLLRRESLTVRAREWRREALQAMQALAPFFPEKRTIARG